MFQCSYIDRRLKSSNKMTYMTFIVVFLLDYSEHFMITLSNTTNDKIHNTDIFNTDTYINNNHW